MSPVQALGLRALEDGAMALTLAGEAARLGDLLARVAGRIRHVTLERLSPFAVPMLMEIGKERSPGQAGDAILAEAESELIAEALP